MKRGILLIALGHRNYGEMAANLAASIKYRDHTMPIHLVHSVGSIDSLDQQKLSLFDSMAICPKEAHTWKGNHAAWIKAKTWMYDLSPFDSTIFLDVDMVCLHKKPLAEIFDAMDQDKVGYTIQNRDYIDLGNKEINEKYSLWVNVKEVKQAYGIKKGRYYSLHSEFVYFKKNQKNQEFFDLVKDIYDNPKVDHTSFAGAMPDELAFAIATAIKGHYPHKTEYLPIFWQVAADGQRPSKKNLSDDYYGFSVGGKVYNEYMVKMYNEFTQAFCYQGFGITTAYKLKDKKRFLPERQNF